MAGISGGADSVCLFFALLELQKEMDFAFYAVHINHGYRGEASDRDEQFVRDLCEKYGVPLQVFSVDLESTGKKRGNNLWRKQGGRSAGNCLKRKCRAGTPAKLRWRTMRMIMPRHFCGICAADAGCMVWAGSVRSTASISVRFSE